MGMLVGFSYSGGRRPLSGTPWGELFAGTFLGGLVITLVYFAGTGSFSPEVLRLSLPSTAMVAALLAVNHTCDRGPDQLAGRRTLAVVLGPLAPWVPFVLGTSVWGLSFALLWRTFTPLSVSLFLGGAIIAGAGALSMRRRGFSAQSKGPQMRTMLGQLVLFSLIYASSLLVQAPLSY
ncbi:MAG: prenyltransferase, partial [Spirochaetales bacterium]|nr:prenyltransferase [Spirochaetales bacterium]